METETKEEGGRKIKPLYILIVAVLVVAAIGITYLAVSSSARVVAFGDTINVSYTGTFTNGTVFGSNVGGQPLQFTVGANELITGFNNAVVGMSVGENKTVTVPVNEAYGPVNPALIVSMPSNALGNQTAPEVGMGVSTIADGQQLQGVIIAVNQTTVTANFNPPLAGKTLIFNIKILAITKGRVR